MVGRASGHFALGGSCLFSFNYNFADFETSLLFYLAGDIVSLFIWSFTRIVTSEFTSLSKHMEFAKFPVF